MQKSMVYLIPTFLAENATHTIPPYVIDALKSCQVIFAENERSARRFIKNICKEFVIDDCEWFTIHKKEEEQIKTLQARINAKKNIAIISEAGCPGVADPGQILIATAQKMNATIKPLVGPSAILLALMGSGMNGQGFEFTGYLPIDNTDRIKKIKEMEQSSQKNNCTKIFIETPYRNNQLLSVLLAHCQPHTQLCIAAELTSATEYIKTKTILDWKKEQIDLHKKPTIFLLHAQPVF